MKQRQTDIGINEKLFFFTEEPELMESAVCLTLSSKQTVFIQRLAIITSLLENYFYSIDSFFLIFEYIYKA